MDYGIDAHVEYYNNLPAARREASKWKKKGYKASVKKVPFSDVYEVRVADVSSVFG